MSVPKSLFHTGEVDVMKDLLELQRPAVAARAR